MSTNLGTAVELIGGCAANVEQKLASADSLTREEKQGIVDALLKDMSKIIENLQHVASSLEGIQVVRKQISELKQPRA